MPEVSAGSNIRIYLTSAATIFFFGFAILCMSSISGVWWMLSSVLSVLSALFSFRLLKKALRQARARQRLIQTYLDRLLMAETPDERQPILQEMSARGLLKGIRLSSSDLEDLDLSFADFSKTDLSGATLSGANLTGANLTGAVLSYATLSYTILNGATLKGANLRGVNLRGADLRQANLSNAFLRGANLVNASLIDAVLYQAQLHGANLQDADLRNVDLNVAVLIRATLPNGKQWQPGMDSARFTDPDHPSFWQANDLYPQMTPSITSFQSSRRRDSS